jgi:hypothetical protein
VGYEEEREARSLLRCDCQPRRWFRRFKWNPECPAHGGFETQNEVIDKLVGELQSCHDALGRPNK